MHTYKTEKTEMVELEACLLSSCHNMAVSQGGQLGVTKKKETFDFLNLQIKNQSFSYPLKLTSY